jgi:hypothetical protein
MAYNPFDMKKTWQTRFFDFSFGLVVLWFGILVCFAILNIIAMSSSDVPNPKTGQVVFHFWNRPNYTQVAYITPFLDKALKLNATVFLCTTIGLIPLFLWTLIQKAFDLYFGRPK